MPYPEVLVIAVALAMDALAVAVSTGLKLRCTIGQTLRMAGAFGSFQFFMPLLGWFLGSTVKSYIEAFDHWIAFGLLAFVGVRMLREGLGKEDGEEECLDPTRGLTLLMLALATSIDALAVGISIAVLQVDIWMPAVVIGVVCFILTIFGLHLGRVMVRPESSLGSTLGKKANVIGGLVLVGIGVKILIEHLFLS
ncbi:manganese efflux pump MntP family protein [Desulfovibrio sp. OttesenSCG-928-C14]|nr:manganese efflux pump MntP family protein [Desulfovibrio sp. OttesenSCG-928-C14]